MPTLNIKPTPLTAEAFSPFGDVIEVRDGLQCISINNGSTDRFHDLAKVQTEGKNAHTLINIFRAQTLDYPLTLTMLERHPLGSQAFIPTTNKPYLIVVAPESENFTSNDIVAFSATGSQGINYHKNVWHHPILALHGESDFLVVDRGGEGKNCDERDFIEGDTVILSHDL